MSESRRRSGRSRQANKKYAGGDWNKETLRLLRESSESSNPTSIDSDDEILISRKDDEFDEQEVQAASHIEGVDEDDNLSVHSGSSKSSHIPTPPNEEQIEDGEDEIIGSTDDEDDDEEGTGRHKSKKSRSKKPHELHFRGTELDRSKSGKYNVWQTAFGPDIEDMMPMLEMKDLWMYKARDVTLPSRLTTDQARKRGWLRKPKVESENCTPTDPGIPQHLFDRQNLRQISLEEAKKRLFYVNGLDHQIVLGPWMKQQIYSLPHAKPISLGQAWKRSAQDSETSYHSGWLINIGEKVQHMAWSPHDGSEQHLALVCRSTPQQRESVQPLKTNSSPAFSPSAAYPNSIQIWSFMRSDNGLDAPLMDYKTVPLLSQILGCNFGDVKQMEWLKESENKPNTHTGNYLGVLVVLTSDGYIRFIRIPKPDASSIEAVCLEVVTPVSIVKSPDLCLFTCFAVASSTDVILGTSSGHIMIYNTLGQSSGQENLQPYYSIQTLSTYVLSISIVDEDEYRHFLASASASGSIQLIDLRAPDQDKLTNPRARIPTRNLIYSRHCRSFITTIDSSGNTEPRGNAQTTLGSHNLRHFYATTAISRYPEGSGTATTLVGSFLHPFVLLGNTGGTVWTQNIARRVLPTGRGPNSETGAWTQKVVEYEWIPKPQSALSNQSQGKADLYNGAPVRPGISRMHHGFKPEKLDLSNAGDKKRKVSTSGLNGDSAIQITFEEEQTVTAIAWNNNPSVAGWVSIGWGSGVVFVTDLCHDVK